MLQGLKLGYVSAVMPAAWSCVQLQKVQPLPSLTRREAASLTAIAEASLPSAQP